VTIQRFNVDVDVTGALPPGSAEAAFVTTTIVVDPELLPERPTVILAVPGGTYHRRYWDLQPPGRSGYSQAEHFAAHGIVFIAEDYFGGGDSTRPADGDFIGLEMQADVAHEVLGQVRKRLQSGELVPGVGPFPDANYVGIGQSLGGFITMIQQGRYDDYPGVGIFGASPLLVAGTREQPDWDAMSIAQRRQWIMADNARQSGIEGELPAYHGAPREQYRGIFHVLDVPDDLVRYDEAECHTLIPRMSGVDGMTPGFAQPFADQISCPVFLAFGEHDVSADPRREPSAYPASSDITMVVIPNMAHMHNFADSRLTLWERFRSWLPVVTP
jgi:pimeloyl-ACP methyl ester carboxylesterase